MTFKDDQFAPQDRTQYTGDSSAQAAEFKPGQIIGDNYRVLAWIGAGGMGNVYRVQHTIMQTEYALKTLSAEKVTEKAWLRFQNEAQAIARMTHPNIVAIYNLGLHEGRLPYYVMELLDGPALSDILKTAGPLETEEALHVFIEICTGLSFAHKKGIVHRDIKPANIVLVENSSPGGGRAKIVDFGIVKLTTDIDENRQKLTNLGEICGSPYYMSPEQCDGSKIDARSDIYSLGCTLFEALTGNPPYRGRNAMETMMLHQSSKPPALSAVTGGKVFPARLEQAVNTLLAKAPMDRYQNMDLVVDDLKAIQKGLIKSGDNRDLSERRRGKKEAVPGPATGSEDKHSAQTARIRRPVGRPSQLAEDEKGEQVGHGPAINFKSLVAAAVILIVAVGGCIWWQFEANRKKGEAIATRLSNISPSSAGLTPTARVIDKTPFVSVSGAGDKRQIDCHFPDDTNLGEILLDSPDKSADTKVIICTGRQKIEGKHRLYFFPSVACINNPDYFCKFGPDLLYSITLPARELEYKDSVTRAMSRITQVKGLLRLDLFNCEAVSDDVLPLLDQSEHLEDLALDANCIGTKKLILGKTINRIKYLRYTYSSASLARRFSELHDEGEDDEDRSSGRAPQRRQYRGHGFGRHRFARHEVPNITELLECLTKSPDLQVLEIPKFSLRPRDLQLISQIKNLRVVDLSESNIVSPNVELLSNLKHLQVFHVDRCMINGAALPAFKKLAAHSLKIISMNSTAMPASEVELFRKELPGVSVNDY